MGVNTKKINNSAELNKLTEIYHELESIEKEEPEKLSQDEVRARYFRRIAKEKEAKERSIEENSNRAVVEGVMGVKEGMTEEEYEVKMREIAKRDKERLRLENAFVEISEANIVRDEKGDG